MKSYAKINLFLQVEGKRGDGYHTIASLFQTISLADELTIEFASEDQFTCSEASLEEDNLVLDAIRLFRSKTDWIEPLKIHLEKNIPMESGLGGGSSNAAATLKRLNELSQLELTDEDLAEMGAELGSDVPFFIYGGTAYCTGRGEKVRKMPSLPSEKITLVFPKYGLSTATVYKEFTPTIPSNPHDAVKSFYEGKPHYFNQLESAAFKVAPALATLKKELLDSGFHTVVMSGSGSTLFCLGPGSTKEYSIEAMFV